MSAIPQRHHSVGEFDQMRPHSGSNVQTFYANQRHQSRPNEAEQMLQAKRRMAAQRERELRNYHQEQQYNRSRLMYAVFLYPFANDVMLSQTYRHRANLTVQSAPTR